MKKIVYLCSIMCLLYSCSKFEPTEGTYIDRDTEKILLVIEKKDGDFWLNQNGISYKIVENDSQNFVQFKNFEAPLDYDQKNGIITFRNSDYISLSKSVKNKFIGKWKESNGPKTFNISMNLNNELIWDVLNEDNSNRYYPKRTELGYHFNIGQDTVSYKIVDGDLIDNKGNKYIKDTESKSI